jgi:predicted NBD/HSP70 family sugar kinase
VNDDDGLALAFDVGGTTIKAELVDRAGTVVASEQRPTLQGHRARDAVAEVGRTLLAQRPDAPVVGAGVVPGLVDREAGIATYSASLGWRHLELVRSLGPALVVIGGGLSRAGEGLLDPLRVAFRQRTPVVHPADVTVSALGDRGGVIGAALLARDGWAPES